jgi:hypothetical protein
MAQKYFEDQFDDEEMMMLFRKHPIVMRKALVFGSLMLLFGVIPSLVVPTFQVFFIGLGVGFALMVLIIFYSWIGWWFSVYIVTNQRFIQISQKGLWQRSVVDIGVDKIQMVSYQVKGFQETLLGFGTIVVQTYVGELVIHDVHHPKKVQKRLSHILRELGISINQTGINQVNEEKE